MVWLVNRIQVPVRLHTKVPVLGRRPSKGRAESRGVSGCRQEAHANPTRKVVFCGGWQCEGRTASGTIADQQGHAGLMAKRDPNISAQYRARITSAVRRCRVLASKLMVVKTGLDSRSHSNDKC